ncbi:MAG: protease pro-enzyme activation domain-containing protein [Acidobacteriota bacterium]|nr:protease pro-enzyme activation domain-containing protein [Acidobacteriota bacterium]
MERHPSAPNRLSACVLLLLASAFTAGAQPARITRAIDSRSRTTLAGHIHRHAVPENDMGRVSPSLPLSYVTLALAPSTSQQADLEKLLVEQQTPGSANYQKWLTPEEYAQRFGVSQSDLGQLTAWLQAQGLTIASVARGRNWIAVNGAAAQVEAAFQTELHHYVVNGETHFANSTEPSVPAALGNVVKTIRGLNNFRLRPALRVPRDQVLDIASPLFTSGRGNHYLAPNDLATIYNITPLYSAGIDGSGQKIVIAGQTQVDVADIQLFRSTYNLPVNNPQVILVPNSQDPGVSSSDLAEADLDLEWSGAVARKAAIIYVYTSDVMAAVQYAIDQNLAPVVSTSYGLCEIETGSADGGAMRSWAQQGNAQGITWFSASGDSGGADCGDSQNNGLAVDMPASIPEVTGVGGTEFQEGAAQYWNTGNDGNSASVLSYIPETAWNDSAADGSPSSTGGGASMFYSKPSWQSAPGVPGDNARHVPDVSLTASANHDGYLVYTKGAQHVYGGTSVPTPAFAGIAALLNHYLGSTGVGNINPALYSLARTNPAIFHDITSGDNIVTVPCSARSRNCVPTAVGFSAGAGYDSVTGLGSVDTYKLVTGWNGGTAPNPRSSASITLLSNLNSLAAQDVIFLTATVTGANGVTPAGVVQFSASGNSLGTASLAGSAGTSTATLPVSGAQLPLGSGNITALYQDSGSATATASINVNVTLTGSGSNPTPSIAGLTNGASFQQTYAPGMILSVFGSQLATTTAQANSVPLPVSMNGVAVTINGVAAPLYYVSPGQLNIQIPYEVAANGTATVSINNGGRVSSGTFNVASAAPGIFTDSNRVAVPYGSASRGQIITLFVTGVGLVSPAVSTGAAPSPSATLSELPAPVQNATVTVGGVQAPLTFVGIPWGLAGVLQINYQVPSGIATGPQPVIVKMGPTPSAPATLTITN